tara:strand:- start:2449 stop:4005 length:1557 start_codon:yes stop_codon:yes gene_type:complete
MYVLTTYQFSKEGLSELKKLEPFPSVYIIENGNEIYIGEGIDPVKRLKTHLRDQKVKSPAKMHIISNYDFNVSVAKDLESYLIQLIKAEGKYKMINKDQLGIRHNYYMKNSYQQRFMHIWENLIEMGIGHSPEEEIKNTQIYEFSPFKSLTSDQQYIVDEILTQINEGTHKVFVVQGDPGSGKTILANYLLKELTDQGKDAALVFSMTSIRKTVQEVFKSVLGMDEKVIGPSDLRKKKYEVLIVDEAHRLNRRKNLSNYGNFDKLNQYFGLGNDGDQLDWVSKSADITILFYDSLQSIKPSDIEPEKLKKFIEESNALVLNLEDQIRIQGGNEYLEIINNILYQQDSPNLSLNNYEFKIFNEINDMQKLINKKNNSNGFSRLIAGYDWDWQSKDGSKDYDIEINGTKLKWNSKTEGWMSSKDAVNEVGSVHTTQAYTLNYAGVIVGPSLSFNKKENKINVHPELYRDRYGKQGIDEDQVKDFILNIYYVLLTRARLGTYVYIVDKDLRNYFKDAVLKI